MGFFFDRFTRKVKKANSLKGLNQALTTGVVPIKGDLLEDGSLLCDSKTEVQGLRCIIEAPYLVGNGSYMYRIAVEKGCETQYVHRRFEDFLELCNTLKKTYPKEYNKLPKLPSKSFFANRSEDLVKRSKALEVLLSSLVHSATFRKDLAVGRFLKTDLNEQNLSGSDPKSGTENESSSFTSEEEGRDSPSGTSTSDIEVDLGKSEKRHVKPMDFEFMKIIGRGSYGKVMLATHRESGSLYAVKVLNKRNIIKRNESRHIMQERDILIKILNHPFLVGLHYSFQTSDKLYFVLDFVNGGELFFHLQRSGHFNEVRAKFYSAEITCALSYLHSRGIIYRDLKPENILLDNTGHIILTDFGLCKDGIRESGTTSTFCGTPEYLAPEVIRKEKYTKSVDWWCLGCVLYEMLTGLPPFYTRNTKQLYDNILNQPLTFKHNVGSSAARDILTGLLHKDKNHRLGATDDGDEIKNHAFFHDINWTELEQRKLKPPFIPRVRNDADLNNIDPEFTKEAIPQSVYRSVGSTNASVADHEFKGFSYMPSI